MSNKDIIVDKKDEMPLIVLENTMDHIAISLDWESRGYSVLEPIYMSLLAYMNTLRGLIEFFKKEFKDVK